MGEPEVRVYIHSLVNKQEGGDFEFLIAKHLKDRLYSHSSGKGTKLLTLGEILSGKHAKRLAKLYATNNEIDIDNYNC
ncbi:MAG: hypothetical protein KatS3mg033_1515 [Thermonema sp.]|nr:MAG: hypothetical protein KatS3mg033_1515 [Thermonema sp.]